jgi:DNA end-binding protein Ku
MPRPIWKGHISFGLVSIPVTLFTAISETNTAPAFHFIDKRNQKRVKNLRINEETGEEVPWEDVVKGYEYEKDKYVILSDTDFDSAAVENNQKIDIEDFVDRKSISPIIFHKPYYLISEKKDEKGYVLLREILKKSGKAGIAKVVISKRQYLAAILPLENALVLELLLFNDELKGLSEFEFPGESIEKYKINESEMKIAEKLIEMMSSGWKPEKYHDDYTEKLYALIDRKIKQPGSIVKAPKSAAPGKYKDFMEILKQSIQLKEKVTGHKGKNHKAA